MNQNHDDDPDGGSFACGWVVIVLVAVFLLSICVTGLLVSVIWL